MPEPWKKYQQKPWEKYQQQTVAEQQPEGTSASVWDKTWETIKHPFEEIGQGIQEIGKGKYEGAVRTGAGVLHTAFLPFTAPYTLGTSAIEEGLKDVNYKDPITGNQVNLGKEITTPLHQLLQLPFDIVKGGSELTKQGLKAIGIDTSGLDDSEVAKLGNELLIELSGLGLLKAGHTKAGQYVKEQVPLPTTGKVPQTLKGLLPERTSEPINLREIPKEQQIYNSQVKLLYDDLRAKQNELTQRIKETKSKTERKQLRDELLKTNKTIRDIEENYPIASQRIKEEKPIPLEQRVYPGERLYEKKPYTPPPKEIGGEKINIGDVGLDKLTDLPKPTTLSLPDRVVRQMIDRFDNKLREADKTRNENLYDKTFADRQTFLNKLSEPQKIEYIKRDLERWFTLDELNKMQFGNIKLLPAASEISLKDGSKIRMDKNGLVDVISTQGKTQRRPELNLSDVKNRQVTKTFELKDLDKKIKDIKDEQSKLSPEETRPLEPSTKEQIKEAFKKQREKQLEETKPVTEAPKETVKETTPVETPEGKVESVKTNVEELTPKEILTNRDKFPTPTAIKEAQKILGNKFDSEFSKYVERNKPVDNTPYEQGRILEDFARKTVAADKMGIKDINKDIIGEANKFKPSEKPIEVGEKSPLFLDVKDVETGKTYRGYGNRHDLAMEKVAEHLKIPMDEFLERGDRFKVIGDERTAKEIGEQNKIISKEAYEKARQDVKDIFNRPSSFPSQLESIKPLVKIAAYHIENGARTFAQYSRAMIKEFGNKIRPLLTKIWNEVKNTFGEAIFKAYESKYNPTRPMKLTAEEFSKNLREKKGIKEEVKTSGKTFDSVFENKLDDAEYQKYRDLRNQGKTFKGRIEGKIASAKNYAHSLGEVYNKLIRPKDTQIEQISKPMFKSLNKLEQDTGFILIKRGETINKFLKGINKFDKNDKYDFELASMNSDGKVINKLIDKYGLQKEYKELRNMLNEIAKDSNLETTEHYFPRIIKDYKGFLKLFEDIKNRNIFDKLIEEKLKKNPDLTEADKAQIIDNALRGYEKGISLSKIGNEKERIIKTINADLSKYYYDPFTSLARYVQNITERQEARRFFGKIPGEEKTIGELVLEKIKDNNLDYEKANRLQDLLEARFANKPSPKIISGTRKLVYMEKLGQLRSAIVQTKDLAKSLYRNGTIETTRALYNVITGKNAKHLEDIGVIDNKIAQELSDPSRLTKMLDENMKWAGFTKLDVFGKEVFINSYLRNMEKKLASGNKNAEARLGRLFEGEELQKVKQDILNKNFSDEVKLLLFTELSRTQPITRASLPMGYDVSPKGRIFYTFKTFALRQFDFIMDETKREWQRGNKWQASKNSMRLAIYMGLLGAGVDTINNILLGRKMDDLDDSVLYNLMDAAGINKYVLQKYAGQSITDAFLKGLVSFPLPYVDNIYADIKGLIKEGKFKGNIIKSVPIIGQPLKERLFPYQQKNSEIKNFNPNFNPNIN
jgi:hypothetical protein